MATMTDDWNSAATDDLWNQAKTAADPTQTPASSDTGWDLGTSSTSSTPAATAVPRTPAATSTASPYAPLVQQINATPDPNAKAVTQDTLGRQLFSDLQADGHDVSWDGGNLLVDGKPYSVAGDYQSNIEQPGAIIDAGTGATTGAKPAASTTPAPTSDYLGSLLTSGTDPAAAIAQFNQQTGRVSGNEAEYYPPGSHGPGSPALIGLPEGYFAQQPDGSWAWTEEPNRDAGGGSGGGSLVDVTPWLNAAANIRSSYTPTPIDPSTISGGPNEDTENAFIANLLQNPDVISPQMAEEMKSKESEQQMVAGQAADEDLARFGNANDLGASPWLAAGRAGNLYNTRQNIISGGRDIDITAAEQNATARQTVASIGAANVAANLQKSGMIADIGKFNETIKQQAASLGISAEALHEQVVTALLSLQEKEQEFGGNLGLQYDELQRLLNNDEWTHAAAATGQPA